ncbi:MAG: N-acetylneuraminate synthase family protein, partial [Halioglobus sp.]|nr:N-acetylneuraminate synthase family protein [Halioglobus sp.]
MKIYRELSPFLVVDGDSIREALAKIEQNKHKIVYVVDERSSLLGSFADGDFRRWCLEQQDIDLASPVVQVCNRNCISMLIDSRSKDIELELEHVNSSIPLLDDFGHVVALAEKGSSFVTIGEHRISGEDATFVIAEIGNNHQGSLEQAKALVDLAVEAGADCAKFQMRTMSELYGSAVTSANPEQDLGSQYALDLLERFQLRDDELFEVFDYCNERGIVAMCTPWDCESLEKLEKYGMPAYKIASADLTNFTLLNAAAETGKPLLCSTGMSSEDEIREAAEFLERHKAQFIFLHCNSTYPTPYKDVNLGYLENLREITRSVVGYSGHERGFSVALAAVSLGAKVIEKHLTTDRSLEGNDHTVSLLPDEFAQMVREVRVLEEALGAPRARAISQGEMANREVLAKSLFAKNAINSGQLITESDIVV